MACSEISYTIQKFDIDMRFLYSQGHMACREISNIYYTEIDIHMRFPTVSQGHMACSDILVQDCHSNCFHT